MTTQTSGQSSSSTAPLDRFLVLDFTRVIAGPYMTAMLADFGCDVIKIEAPGHGDDARTHYPPGKAGEASIFVGLNRSKKSVVLDLRTEMGQKAAYRLALKADILVENFRPGVMERLGLDFEVLKKNNDRLIYCSISGYSSASPFSELPGYDPIVQAETGLMYLTGDSSMPPIRAGGSLIDVLAGTHGAMAAIAAVNKRRETGRGEFINVSLYNTALSALGFTLQGPILEGKDPKRLGNTSYFMAPNGLFDTADGKIMVSAGNNRLFQKLSTALGQPDLAQDPRFANNKARLDNVDSLIATISQLLATQSREYWIGRLRAHGVPAGSVRTPVEVLSSPEARGSGMFYEVDHPTIGRMETIGNPVNFSASSVTPPSAAPLLGADTASVLADVIGYSPSEIEEMKVAGVMGSTERCSEAAE